MENKKCYASHHKKISDLIPYINNARTHSGEQINQVASSIKEFGFTNPVLIDSDNGIVAGHGRILAAQKLNIEEVPCIVLDGLTESQKKAYILADNKLAMNAGWNDELLKIELEGLKELDFDLGVIGFSTEELDALIKVDGSEGLTDEDEVPEPPEAPVSVLGDIWLLGSHRLMCGSSTVVTDVEALMDGKKADMVFTDPPYGVDYEGGSKKWDKLIDDHVGTDIYTESVPIMAMFCDGPIYTWYAGTKPKGLYNAVESVGDIHSLIIWKKNNSTFNMGINYKQKHEPCLYWKPKGKTLKWAGGSKEDTVWEIKRESKNEFHPTQKPVELADRAINNHSIGMLLDLFGGSGATLIACEKNNRNCRMMELDPKYIDVIINRWQNFTGKEATHEETGQTFQEVKDGRI